MDKKTKLSAKAKPPGGSMYVFVGGSISSRDAKEAREIAERVRIICKVLDRHGHTYDANLLTDTSLHREAKNKPSMDIPRKYLRVSRAVVSSVAALRVENAPYELSEEIACYRWSIDLLEKAGACIWDLTKSSTGSGIEMSLALAMRKPCLALFDRPTISTMVNGCTSRLLTVRRWDDDIEKHIERFLEKAARGYDRSVKFNLTQEQRRLLSQGAEDRGCENESEYLRYLIEQDRKELDELEKRQK